MPEVRSETKYKMTVGLEVHVELATQTKMFCRSKNDPDEKRPNVNICPICLGHPGTLPTINKEAVRLVLRVGVALGGTLADFTEFDRKNYFYPDIPKGYQISQYKYPLVSGGELAGVAITRVHLEEDTARSQHDPATGESLVDYNRAGVPLMELVTEPVITSAKEAGDFARELQLLLSPEYLNVSEANMEKGELRVEVNISLSDKEEEFGLNHSEGMIGRTQSGDRVLGTKVEVKNLNSFRAVEKAIEYEFDRQLALLNAGKPVVQETRGWDENKNETFSQRRKEFSHDYRYFPDPDLPKLKLSQIPDFKDLAATLPELPEAKRRRWQETHSLKAADVEVYINHKALAELFEAVAQKIDPSFWQTASNYIVSDIVGLLSAGTPLPKPEHLAELMTMVGADEVSSRGAKDILPLMITENKSPRLIAETKGLFQKSNQAELAAIVEKVIKDNPTIMVEFKSGKEKALQFLIGQGMKESKGTANPGMLADLFKEKAK